MRNGGAFLIVEVKFSFVGRGPRMVGFRGISGMAGVPRDVAGWSELGVARTCDENID